MIHRFLSLLAAVALLTGLPHHAAAQADPGRIFTGFSSSGFLNTGLVTFNPDGANAVFLTPMGAPLPTNPSPFHATMSRDGRKIAFAINETVGGSLVPRIYAMNADGTGLIRLTQNTDNRVVDTFPAISPDGTMVAFISNRQAVAIERIAGASAFEAMLVRIDGTGLAPVTFAEDHPAVSPRFSNTRSVCWAPDSRRVAVRGTRFLAHPSGSNTYRLSLHTVNSDGTNMQLLELLDLGPQGLPDLTHTADINGAIDWSPDGRLLMWVHAASNRLVVPDVIRFHAFTGSTPPSLTYAQVSEGDTSGTGMSVSQSAFRFSPESGRLLYFSSESDGLNLNFIDTGGGNFHRFKPALPATPVFVTSSTMISNSLWWHGGPNAAAPASLTLPAKLTIPGGGTVPLFPQLRDGAGNLLSRTAIHYQTTGVGSGANVGLFKFGADWNTFVHDPSFASGPHDIVARHAGLTSAPMRVFAGTARFRFASRPASLQRSGTTIFADLDITNTGDGRAATIVLTEVTLNGVANNRTFGSVLNIAAIQPGATGGTSGSFGFLNAGASGAPGLLKIRGTFIGGSFSTSIRLTLP